MSSTRAMAFGLVLAAVAVPYHAQLAARDLTPQPEDASTTGQPEQTASTRTALPAPSVGTVGAGVAPSLAPYGGAHMQSFPAAPVATETVGAPVSAAAEPATGPRKVRTLTVRRDAAEQPAATTIGRGASMAARKHTARPFKTARAAASVLRRKGTTARRAGRPLVITPKQLTLTPSQRRVVYQNIVKQRDVSRRAANAPSAASPEAAPRFLQPTALSGYAVPFPVLPSDAGSARADAAAPAMSGSVGGAVPASVRLAPVPRAALKQVPQARRYSYAVVNNRVLLVDPATSTIVADVTP